MDHEAARPKGRSVDDEPNAQPMRPVLRGQIARNPSTDQKKVRRLNLRKSAGSDGPGAYVHHEWVSVEEAKRMHFPNEDGPGAFDGRGQSNWVPFTCAKCGKPASSCTHKREASLKEADFNETGRGYIPGHVQCSSCGYKGHPALGDTGAECKNCGSYSVSSTKPKVPAADNARHLDRSDYQLLSSKDPNAYLDKRCPGCGGPRNERNAEGACNECMRDAHNLFDGYGVSGSDEDTWSPRAAYPKKGAWDDPERASDVDQDLPTSTSVNCPECGSRTEDFEQGDGSVTRHCPNPRCGHVFKSGAKTAAGKVACPSCSGGDALDDRFNVMSDEESGGAMRCSLCRDSGAVTPEQAAKGSPGSHTWFNEWPDGTTSEDGHDSHKDSDHDTHPEAVKVSAKTATMLDTQAWMLNPGDQIRMPNGKTQKVNRVRPHETAGDTHVYVDTDGGTALVKRTDGFQVVPRNSQQQSLPGYGSPGGNSNALPGDPQTSGSNIAPSSKCPQCGGPGTLRQSGQGYTCSRCGYNEAFGGAGGHAFSDAPSTVQTFSTINAPIQSAIARRATAVLNQKETQ